MAAGKNERSRFDATIRSAEKITNTSVPPFTRGSSLLPDWEKLHSILFKKTVEKSIRVDILASRAYGQWTQFWKFLHFMKRPLLAEPAGGNL